jgi:hypothetical protein
MRSDLDDLNCRHRSKNQAPEFAMQPRLHIRDHISKSKRRSVPSKNPPVAKTSATSLALRPMWPLTRIVALTQRAHPSVQRRPSIPDVRHHASGLAPGRSPRLGRLTEPAGQLTQRRVEQPRKTRPNRPACWRPDVGRRRTGAVTAGFALAFAPELRDD